MPFPRQKKGLCSYWTEKVKPEGFGQEGPPGWAVITQSHTNSCKTRSCCLTRNICLAVRGCTVYEAFGYDISHTLCVWWQWRGQVLPFALLPLRGIWLGFLPWHRDSPLTCQSPSVATQMASLCSMGCDTVFLSGFPSDKKLWKAIHLIQNIW